MKFRKLPVVVEAEQWFRGRKVEGVRAGLLDGYGLIGPSGGDCKVVVSGDWIITEPTGERYPCKPDIFAATYERVKHG